MPPGFGTSLPVDWDLHCKSMGKASSSTLFWIRAALAIIIDGVNETGRDEDAGIFANKFRKVRVLATSQNISPAVSRSARTFAVLQLPSSLSEYAECLLAKRLWSG